MIDHFEFRSRSICRPVPLLLFAILAVFGLSTVLAVESSRERVLMDSGWQFHLGDAPDAANEFDYPEIRDLAKTRKDQIGHVGNLATVLPDPAIESLGARVSFVQPNCIVSNWREVDLPHDWAVELPFDENADYKHGFKAIGPGIPQNSVGWYRREFDLATTDKGKSVWLQFDGVYRNSLVWLNGHCLGRHLDGYSSFRYNISRFANYGGKNRLAVRVDASRFEGWFYEGAGIYRHVWLEKTSPLHITPDGVFVSTSQIGTSTATVHIEANVTNEFDSVRQTSVQIILLDPDGNPASTNEVASRQIPSRNSLLFAQNIIVHAPQLWELDKPVLYRAKVLISSQNQLFDQCEVSFGVRTIQFNADQGFLLNGRRVEIKGTCNHQDHAGVGVALPDALQYYRMRKLKEMGCNAIRTSHNPPAPELLDACDRLGMLVMDENRRMDTNGETLAALTETIRRDRNHPSVFIWSLGNEEPYLQGTNAGAQVAAVMQEIVHKLDPTRLCTVAMNGKWGLGFSTVIDVQGFNYGTKNIGSYHAKHLAQPEIGTETASTVTTRGIYADEPKLGYVGAYGEKHPGWGAKPWEWWPYYATNPFASGGFVWTGFDYRGEPTPYKWPCISSHFGLMDTCGFPKDIYYYYQSWWTDKPVIHIAPHWNWPGKEGQPILVRVFSNCRRLELYLNGQSLGKQIMQPNGFLDWMVAYQPGVLSAKGFDENGKLIAESKVETTGAPVAIRLLPDRIGLHADGEDVNVVNVSVVDTQGRVVPVAENLIHFALSGPGRILGVGNGDPSSHEADKGIQRKLFGGQAQVLVQASSVPGEIKVSVTSDGLNSATTIMTANSPNTTDHTTSIANREPER